MDPARSRLLRRMDVMNSDRWRIQAFFSLTKRRARMRSVGESS